ncbi:hypothetical protein ABI59_06880 [Acidobacteria bacterium Mor1]|nr:hypothetical protein ABI59_06880 [Acidobacteria bacterium Mor1]
MLFGLAAGFPSWSATTRPAVDLDVRLAAPYALAGPSQTAYLRVGLTGVDRGRGRRAPVNVAIVLDRSGSMSGEKIEEAKRGAIAALDRLGPEDIVSVVTYNNTVDVLVPATKLADRQSIYARIRSIGTGGNTALFAGVSKGAAELRKFLDAGRVNTLILLSDGLANVGPQSPGELADLGSSLAREGIAVTTVGLGLSYNEDLMTRLAMSSDGNHFFVEESSDLEYAFATEFGDALSTVAQGVTIRIECPPGVRPVRVLGRKAQIQGSKVFASLNQVFRDQTRYLLLEVELAPGYAGQSRRVGDVQVQYRDLATGRSTQTNAHASVAFTRDSALVEQRTNRDVMIDVVSQIGRANNELAMALRDQGKIEESRAAYNSNSEYLLKNAVELGSVQLDQEATANVIAGENLEGEAWKRERKVQVQLQMKGATQRAPILREDDKKKETKKSKKDD